MAYAEKLTGGGSARLHAECDAIMCAARHHGEHALAGSTIYVAMIKRSGRIGLARPCGACLFLLRTVGIRRIVYTVAKGEFGAERMPAVNRAR